MHTLCSITGTKSVASKKESRKGEFPEYAFFPSGNSGGRTQPAVDEIIVA